MKHNILTALSFITVFNTALTTVQAVELIDQCQTINAPGSYLLTSNLDASGDCLIVMTDYVTIDLDGHVIQGDRTGDGIVDDKSFNNGKQTGLVVRNGTVTGFRFGIAFDRTEGAVIEYMTVSDNSLTGISITNGRVSNNVVFRNGSDGIEADRDSIVSFNQVMNNGFDGMEIGATSVVFGNTVHLNNRTGIRVRNTGTLLANNSSTRNRDDGVSIVCPGVITGNALSRNNLNRNDSVNLRRTGTGCMTSVTTR